MASGNPVRMQAIGVLPGRHSRFFFGWGGFLARLFLCRCLGFFQLLDFFVKGVDLCGQLLDVLVRRQFHGIEDFTNPMLDAFADPSFQ
jgi:hypothetical protein